MFSSQISVGDIATASQYNNLRKDAGLFSGDSVNITYNADNTINTVEHVDYGVTLTLSYNSDQTVSSVTDGTNTWNFGYNSISFLTSITKV